LLSQGVAARKADYFAVGGGLMTAMIMGLTTLVGFDSAANLAEEAKEPLKSVPRAIVGSVAAAAVLGLGFLIVLTIAIKNVPRATASDSAIATILHDQIGSGAEKVFLAGITIAFFGAGVAILAASSRVVFAMSRDSRFPVHRLLRRVNPRTQTPISATILIVIVGVILMVALPGEALLKLIVTGTILPSLIYGGTICLYLAVRGRLGREAGAFSLGRYELAVAIAALTWVLVSLFVLVTPGEALVPDLIVLGLLVAGGVFELVLLRTDRRAFETEPGEVGVVTN
jgi:amino acid transporter